MEPDFLSSSEPEKPVELLPSQIRAGAFEDGSCLCGCGEAAVEGRRDEAMALRSASRLAAGLRAHRLTSEDARRRSNALLESWARAEAPLDAAAHGRGPEMLGPPTRAWLNEWKRQAERCLASGGARRRRRRSRRRG